MCGRYTIAVTPEAVREHFGYEETPNFPPRYNITPTQPVPVVQLDKGKRHFALVRWGLVPSWAKKMDERGPLINARAETIVERPSFRAAMKRRRCLFIADGFYEWQPRAKGPKQPWYMQMSGGGVFAIAGIWEHWIGPNGEEVETAALITVNSNPVIAPIHDRMPAIINPRDYDAWLDAEKISSDVAAALLHPAPDDALEAWPVSLDVNKASNDSPELIQPLAAHTGPPDLFV